jgi:hypothetical protein
VTLGGLWVGNSILVTLSRAIGSLALFCIIGLLVGGAAQMVVNDHARRSLGTPESRGGADRTGAEKPPAPGQAAATAGPAAAGT